MRRISSGDDTWRTATRAGIIAFALLAFVGLVSALLPSGARGQIGGDGGGAVFVEKPKLAKVSCMRRCASRKRARPGSTL